MEPVEPREPVRIRVEAAAETGGGHDVWVGAGLLSDLPRLVRTCPAHRYVIVADSVVADLYGRAAAARLTASGLAVDLIEFPAGEASKTRESWARLTDSLVELGVGRDGCLIALGGGVVSDLGGFLAATYMRGIPCLMVPTTLLAMVDAAIGGKTGVDLPSGKNLVGIVRQPRLVIVDPATLATLPADAFLAGLAEAVKHAAIADDAYLTWIESHAEPIGRREPDAVAGLIERSIAIKAAHVAADTLEAGPRAALNFGHTLGHALESVTGLTLTHGFAVAIGMVAEARLGESLGVTEAGTANRLARALGRLGLPAQVPAGLSAHTILAATRLDKKSRGSRTRYSLIECVGRTARGPGGEWTFEAQPELVERALDATIERLS